MYHWFVQLCMVQNSHLVVEVSEEEVQQEGLALAEGAGDGDNHNGPVADVLA